MAYEKGTKIRVDITGRVGENQVGLSAPKGSVISTTCEIEQTVGNQWYHFLYLNSDSVTGDRQTGGTVTARFDAVVTGLYEDSKYSTTEVMEQRNGEDYGIRHYLCLRSDAVTVLEEAPAGPAGQPEPEPEPMPKPFAESDRIRVAIDGAIDGSVDYALDGTTPVLQANGLYTHRLFLGSDLVTAGDSREEGTLVSARFDATVTGGYREGKSLTTRVQEIRRTADGEEYAGYVHYLYLDSNAVTVLPPSEPDAVPESEPTPRSVSGDRITADATEIESADVLKRIAELEDAAPVVRYRVTRKRNGEILNNGLKVLRTLADVYYFLDERDYRPERFTIEPVRVLSDEDQRELDLLRKLNDAGRSQFGSSDWITSGVLLRRDGDCDADWARAEAVTKLGLGSRYALDDWPLSEISDWNEAAVALLESDYLSVEFNGTTYWGKYTG